MSLVPEGCYEYRKGVKDIIFQSGNAMVSRTGLASKDEVSSPTKPNILVALKRWTAPIRHDESSGPPRGASRKSLPPHPQPHALHRRTWLYEQPTHI
jgi:hypothetical protein